jgi:E3 ubiquitin-protein ligase ATL6/9/15/31/42/55
MSNAAAMCTKQHTTCHGSSSSLAIYSIPWLGRLLACYSIVPTSLHLRLFSSYYFFLSPLHITVVIVTRTPPHYRPHRRAGTTHFRSLSTRETDDITLFTSMAPTPPTSTRPRRHHTILRPPLALALALAIVRPASPQLLQPPPGATVSSAFSPPPSPPVDGVGGRFAVTTSLLFVGLIVALFLLGFFSAFLRRRCGAGADTRGRGGGGGVGSLAASAGAAAGAGLDAAAMEALPVLTYATARAVRAGRGALECAVCLSAFDAAGEKLRLLPGCCHVFHAACVDAWLAAHVTCPVCRADLSDPAVAAAGHVLAADLAADTVVVVNVVDGPAAPAAEAAGQDATPSETAEDRFTLRLPERLRREIDEARRLRRALSASTALPSGGPLASSAAAPRTMSAARPSRRWSGLLRALSGSRRVSEPDGHWRVVPLPTGASNGEVVQEQEDVDKYFSLTFAGFVIDGDVAAVDWHPEVFHVSTGVPAAQR